MSELKKNILATLAYYDVLDFPLKREEIFRYLIRLDGAKVAAAAGQAILVELVKTGRVGEREGFYFLFEREYLVPLRQKQRKISVRKMAKARRAIYWLNFIPYLQAIFASGSLALANCEELSDLDVLVVAKHGRIWLTRFLITAWLTLIGARRKPSDKIAPDKICLNHYITDQSLKIPFESLYNAQNYINLKPLLIREPELVNNFYRANSWLADHLLQYDIMIYHTVGENRETVLGWFAKLVSNAGQTILNNRFGDWLEQKAKRYQIKRIVTNPPIQNRHGHIVYDNAQLAFHPDSSENETLEKYRKNLVRLV